jgi:exosortase
MSGQNLDRCTGDRESRKRPRSATLTSAFVGLSLAALLTALYSKVAWDMVLQWWDDPNYSHGFLVPPFAFYLAWRQRMALRAIRRDGSLLGIPLMLAGAGSLVLGDAAADNFLMRSSLIVVLAGLVLFHLGGQMFRSLLVPFAFLFFMVPLPAVIFNSITFPLQQLAAQQAAWTLDLLGVAVLLDGNIIHLAQFSLGVTEACSGIRSLLSLSAGAVAWGYLFLPTWWGALIMAAATVPITIAANAARIVLTGLIGQQFGVEYASGFFHEFAGVVIYAFAFLCLVGTHSLIRLVTHLFERRGS